MTKIVLRGRIINDEFCGSVDVYYKLHIVMKRYFSSVPVIEVLCYVSELQYISLEMSKLNCRTVWKNSEYAADEARKFAELSCMSDVVFRFPSGKEAHSYAIRLYDVIHDTNSGKPYLDYLFNPANRYPHHEPKV